MQTSVKRAIIEIDEERCDGCGNCIVSCAEGAIQIIDGKAKLISDEFCDGLGACLGDCPQNALNIIEREAAEFDEVAVEEHLAKGHADEPLACGCPSTSVCHITTIEEDEVPFEGIVSQPSTLRQWPVQLGLVPASAPFLQDSDLLLTADCVPFAFPDYHQKLLKNHSLLITCPKLESFDKQKEKLTDIFSNAAINKVTVAHMEVPCCFGLVQLAKQAIQASGKDIPMDEVTVGVRGDLA